MRLAIAICLVLALAVAANGAGVSVKRLTALPGLAKMPPFAMFTGYVPVSANRSLFFWLVESAGNPAKDPIVIWLSGGPGCSSIFALLTEHGPVMPNPDGVTLSLNPYSWNQAATMVYVEAPCGVGFSYSTDGNYTTGDDQTAQDNFVFVQNFFNHFTGYAENSFFVAGESYAGHYVPQLAQLLVEKSSSSNYNFKGIFVGNPALDMTIDMNNYFPFMLNHALIDNQLYQFAVTTCQGQFFPPKNTKCQDIINTIMKEFGHLNPYNIYADCDGPPSIDGSCFTAQVASAFAAAEPLSTVIPLGQTFIPCINLTAPVTYMNQRSVQEALGVAPQLIGQTWYPCSQILNYTQYASTVLPILTELAGMSDMRVMIYSGDVDSCVPVMSSQLAMDSLNLKQTLHWGPWIVNNQVAGYIKGWNANVFFATVKGAGTKSHMVPTFKPVQGLALFSRFVNGRDIQKDTD